MLESCPRCSFWASIMAVLMMMVAMLSAIWWLEFDYKVRPVDEAISPTFLTRTAEGPPELEFRAGETALINYHLRVNRKCPNSFSTSLVNILTRVITIYAPQTGANPNPKIGETQFKTRLRLPEDLLPGEYEIRVRGTFRCNPLRSYVKHYEPIALRIVE